MERFWFLASFITLGFAAITTTALVVAYTFLTQFEKTQVGRQFWLTKFCLALILDWWALVVFVIQPPVVYTIAMPGRTIITFAVGVVMARWLIILIRLQLEHRKKETS